MTNRLKGSITLDSNYEKVKADAFKCSNEANVASNAARLKNDHESHQKAKQLNFIAMKAHRRAAELSPMPEAEDNHARLMSDHKTAVRFHDSDGKNR